MKYSPPTDAQLRRQRLTQLENQRFIVRSALACVRCGCTESRACPGGCWWVSLRPPICSSCS